MKKVEMRLEERELFLMEFKIGISKKLKKFGKIEKFKDFQLTIQLKVNVKLKKKSQSDLKDAKKEND